MPRTIMRSLTIQEIAGVTKPAMKGATAVFMKRDPEGFEKLKPKKGESQKDYLARFMADEKMRTEYPDQKQRSAVAYSMFGKCAALTTAAGEADETHTHLVRLDGYDGPLDSGMTSYADEHSHPWVMGPNGPVIGEINGHTHTIATVGKSADGTPSEEPMADQKTEEMLKAENATLLAKVAALTALTALTDAERAYAKSLPTDAEREKFVTSSAEARAAVLKAAGDANPVVFTSASGEVFRKNDDPRTVAMAKKLDEQAAALAKADAFAKQAAYEKRAAEEIPNLPGTLAVRAEMLKAIDGISNEETRRAALETLKAQNAEMAKALETRGTRSGGAAGSAEERIEALAKKIAVEKGVSFAKAYDLAMASPEGAALYAEYTKARETK